jgi:hypothetical protein
MPDPPQPPLNHYKEQRRHASSHAATREHGRQAEIALARHLGVEEPDLPTPSVPPANFEDVFGHIELAAPQEQLTGAVGRGAVEARGHKQGHGRGDAGSLFRNVRGGGGGGELLEGLLEGGGSQG